MSIRDQEQNELGAFLRARRSELSPSDVDLPEGGRQRRVAGLRREEVAQLAAISTDYYTRLEQGRIGPSGPVPASLGWTTTSAPICTSSPAHPRSPAGAHRRRSSRTCSASSTASTLPRL